MIVAIMNEAQASGVEALVAFADTCHDLWYDEAVMALFELRGEQYHRWRTESPGVSGVSIGTPSISSRLLAGEAVGFGGPPTPFLEGDAVVDEIVAVSRAALDCMGGHIDVLLSAWREAFEQLRQG